MLVGELDCEVEYDNVEDEEEDVELMVQDASVHEEDDDVEDDEVQDVSVQDEELKLKEVGDEDGGDVAHGIRKTDVVV